MGTHIAVAAAVIGSYAGIKSMLWKLLKWLNARKETPLAYGDVIVVKGQPKTDRLKVLDVSNGRVFASPTCEDRNARWYLLKDVMRA